MCETGRILREEGRKEWRGNNNDVLFLGRLKGSQQGRAAKNEKARGIT